MALKQNVVCWFESYVNDMERAKKFYATVLGVAFEDAPPMEGMGDMQMAFFPGAENLPNASGALIKMEGVKAVGIATTSTIVYFTSEDCTLEESRVAAAGGEVHQSKMAIGPHGFVSICLDTEGNTFGLHSLK